MQRINEKGAWISGSWCKQGKLKNMLCERSCPDGVQDYFNHVMTLLFEITEYDLNKSVLTPYEKACSYYPG